MAFTKELRTELVSLLGVDWVKDDPVTLYTYRCDGLTLYTAPPMGVVFPETRAVAAPYMSTAETGRPREPLQKNTGIPSNPGNWTG